MYVLGLSEDLYPGRPSGDSLLPDPVRSAVGPLITLRDPQGTAYRHLLAAFAAAPRVVASFPRGDLRSSSRRLPSRWLLGTLRELAGDSTLASAPPSSSGACSAWTTWTTRTRLTSTRPGWRKAIAGWMSTSAVTRN